MPKSRVSMSARIVAWFEAAPLEVAEEVMGIVREKLRGRRPQAAKASKARPKPKAAPVVAKTGSAANARALGDESVGD